MAIVVLMKASMMIFLDMEVENNLHMHEPIEEVELNPKSPVLGVG